MIEFVRFPLAVDVLAVVDEELGGGVRVEVLGEVGEGGGAIE